ncbi:MAG: DUF433 domain-containing protein [Chloroflexi bacterium]|nr:DUF433 domain-containing protein [Chloroflexota bacterium]MBI3762181.1 DUF433 domain-containing protein [Chloroflexota bacterium]
MSYTITLSDHTFRLLSRRAEEAKRSPSEVAEEVLEQHLSPPHPYIEMRRGAGGLSAVVKGTRIAVANIVGYIQRAGQTPETLAKDIMPHVSLAAIHDALSYYYEHKDEIDREMAQNTEEWSRNYLRERLGEEGYKRITGQIK